MSATHLGARACHSRIVEKNRVLTHTTHCIDLMSRSNEFTLVGNDRLGFWVTNNTTKSHRTGAAPQRSTTAHVLGRTTATNDTASLEEATEQTTEDASDSSAATTAAHAHTATGLRHSLLHDHLEVLSDLLVCLHVSLLEALSRLLLSRLHHALERVAHSFALRELLRQKVSSLIDTGLHRLRELLAKLLERAFNLRVELRTEITHAPTDATSGAHVNAAASEAASARNRHATWETSRER